jgi:hypothetical protein
MIETETISETLDANSILTLHTAAVKASDQFMWVLLKDEANTVSTFLFLHSS